MSTNTYTLPDGRVVKTGASPSPRHMLAAARPWQIRGDTPPNFLRLPSKLSYWLNNQDGDCVTAEEAFNQACAGVFISDSEVGRWARSHGVLNGADLSSVLDWMAQKGFQQDGNSYNVGTKASVDWTNAPLLQNAISKAPIKIAIASGQLQGAVSSKNGWLATGFRHDGNSDHCVNLCGYGTIAWLQQQLGGTVPGGVDGTKPGYALFTWDTVGTIDLPSMLAITDEAWLRTPATVVIGTGTPTADQVLVVPPPVPPGPTPTENSLVLTSDLPAGTYSVGTFGTITVVTTIPAGTSLITPDFFV